MPSFTFNQLMKFFFSPLFFLFLLISLSVSSSSSSQETQPQIQNPPKPMSQTHQVFYLKNTDPIFITRHHHYIKKTNKHRKNLLKMKNKKKNLLKSRAFSAMLPKGFVPPSGSSPCHNQQPDSVSFHCHLFAPRP